MGDNMDKYNSIRNKRLFNSLIFIIILFFIIGIFVTIFLSKQDNNIIKDSLNNFLINIKDNKIDNFYIKNTIISYIICNTIIFILTLSIIGIVVNIISLAYKSFSLSFTIFNIIKIYKLKSIFLISYVIPDIFNLFISLVYSYYLIKFSKKLIDKLFRKKDYNIKSLLKKNLKLYIICLTMFIINTILKLYVVPNMIKPFINKIM